MIEILGRGGDGERPAQEPIPSPVGIIECEASGSGQVPADMLFILPETLHVVNAQGRFFLNHGLRHDETLRVPTGIRLQETAQGLVLSPREAGGQFHERFSHALGQKIARGHFHRGEIDGKDALEGVHATTAGWTAPVGGEWNVFHRYWAGADRTCRPRS